MILKRFKNEMDMFDSYFNLVWGNPIARTFNGTFVDTDKYDIVPKKGYQEGQIKLKEAQLNKLKDTHGAIEKELEDEIKSMKKALSP